MVETRIEAVNARIAVVAGEHAHAGEQRKGAGERRAGDEQVWPHRHIGEGRETGIAIIALLLNSVRRHRSDLAEHVLPCVVNACAAADDRLAVLLHVPHKTSARLKLFHLIGDRAVRRESRIAQKARVRRGRRVDRCRHPLRVPPQPVVERQPVTRLPFVLHEERKLLVADIRRSRRIARDPVRAAALQIEQKGTAGRRRARRTGRRRRHVRTIRAAHGERSEASGRRRRRVAQKARHAVEDVSAFEKAAKDLEVVGVQPFAAGLDCVLAGHDRNVVLHLEPLDQLVDVRSEKKRIAEPERRREAHRRVRWNRRRYGGSWAILARVGEVEFVDLVHGHSAEQIHVQYVDL